MFSPNLNKHKIPLFLSSLPQVFKPDQLIIVLFVKNKEARLLSGVVTRLDVPGNVRRQQAAGFEAVQDSLLDNLTSNGSSRHVLAFGSNGLMTSGMSIKGHVVYTDSNMAAKNVYFSISLNAGDFLRPLQYTTEQFGSAWETLGAERKQKVAGSSVKSMDDFCARAQNDIHLHVAQVIGSEVICSGVSLNDGQTVCLLHAKVARDGVDVSVRTSAVQYSEAVIRHCAVALK